MASLPVALRRSSAWVWIVGILVTAILAYVAHLLIQLEYRRSFDSSVDEVEGRIRLRLERYEEALNHTRGLFLAAEKVTREEFRAYEAGIDVMNKYPGIQGIGFTARIRREHLSAHLREVRSSGFPDYRIWPEFPREEYFSIIYLEPFNWRNQRAFGYDMFTEPVRRQAMAEARDTGETRMSGLVRLVQETEADVQPGFLMYLPVYTKTGSINTIEQRKNALRGFVCAPFRAGDFFRAIFSETRDIGGDRLDVEIFDGDQPSPDKLFFDSDTILHFGSGEERDGFTTLRKMHLFGHPWSVHVMALPAFFNRLARTAPFVIGLIGLMVTGLLFRIARENEKRFEMERDLLEQKAAGRLSAEMARRSAFLADVSSLLSESLNVRETLKRFVDLAITQFPGWCLISLVDEKGKDAAIEVSHRDPVQERTGWRVLAPALLRRDSILCVHCTIESGENRLVTDLDTELEKEFERGQEEDGDLRNLKLKSYLCVLIVARGRTLGALSFFSDSRRYGATDRELAQELAARFALALDNSRLFSEAQESLRQRQDVLAMVSHDLKNPLSSVLLNASLILKATAKSPEIRRIHQFARNIEGSAKNMNQLINDILDVIRIETGGLVVQPVEERTVHLVSDAIELFRPLASERGVVLQTDLPPEELFVLSDRRRIQQVFSNLIGNSLKFTERGDTVSVRVTPEEGFVRFTVADTGKGISPEHLPHIFKRFWQAPEGAQKGSGLGLAIVRAIVEAHGGRIWAESRLGVGTAVHFTLPRAVMFPMKSTA